MSNIAPPSNENVMDFPGNSAIDTCAIWNVLSFGATAFEAVHNSSRFFVIADYVRYECLFKTGKRSSEENLTRMKRLLSDHIQAKRVFYRCSLTVDDLQQVAHLQTIKNLGLGEVASIVVANKIRAGFTTDDGKARKLANKVFPSLEVRTSSQLLGWLVYT